MIPNVTSRENVHVTFSACLVLSDFRMDLSMQPLAMKTVNETPRCDFNTASRDEKLTMRHRVKIATNDEVTLPLIKLFSSFYFPFIILKLNKKIVIVKSEMLLNDIVDKKFVSLYSKT